MSTATALASAGASSTIARSDTPQLRLFPTVPTVSSAAVARRTGLWARLRRGTRRVGRWLAKVAGWLASPKGRLCLTLAGEGLALAGVVSRATMSNTLETVSTVTAPFAPARREGPRVIWG